MSTKNTTNIILVVSIAIFLFGSGYKFGEYQTQKSQIEKPLYNIIGVKSAKYQNIDFSTFWEAWNKIEDKYVDRKKIDPQKMVYGAVKGMVATLDDPYTFFLTPQENKESQDELGGRFEGIGAQLGLKENKIVVISPLKDSPAEKAGIKAGDIIVAVDDKSTNGISLPQVVTKIRGPKGTQVKITVERNIKDISFKITRDVIKIISVELKDESRIDCKSSCGKVAYLKLNQFGENTVDEWDTAIDLVKKEWDSKKIRGLVLDLRDNPGGFLETSVYIAAEFLPKEAVVVKQESTNRDPIIYKVQRTGKLLDIPLVVIVNKGSASASEILGGALRDHKRAVLIGEKTFGKGSVQEALDLSGNSGLHVTIAKWILPQGEWINGKGIEPSVKIENKIDSQNTITRENDLQIEKAIEQIIR